MQRSDVNQIPVHHVMSGHLAGKIALDLQFHYFFPLFLPITTGP